eukprot:6207699-Pleurochrysis_carterae.AAC.1
MEINHVIVVIFRGCVTMKTADLYELVKVAEVPVTARDISKYGHYRQETFPRNAPSPSQNELQSYYQSSVYIAGPRLR